MKITKRQLNALISEVFKIEFAKNKTNKEKEDLIEDLFKILSLNR